MPEFGEETIMNSAEPARGGLLFWPIAAFVILAAVANLWGSYHLGFGLRGPAGLAALVGAITAALTLLGWLVGKTEREAAGERVRGWLRVVFAWPVLVVLCGVLLWAALNWSSVRVIGEKGTTPAFTVTALDASDGYSHEEKASTSSVTRVTLSVGADGRLFRLNVRGYLPTIVEVPPVVGARVLVDRDLRPSPMLLVRPQVSGIRALKGGGKVRLWQVVAPGEEELLAEEPGARPVTGFLFGHDDSRREIPATMRADWRLELTAAGHDEKTLAGLLLNWTRPRFVALKKPLEPGMILRAEVLTDEEKLDTTAQVSLRSEPLADLLLPEKQ